MIDALAGRMETLVAAGEFDAALRVYELANPVERRAPPVRLQAAGAAARMGRLDLALTHAFGALEGFRAQEEGEGLWRATNLAGGIALERGHLAEADAFFRDALRVAERLGDHTGVGRACNNLATVAHQQGRVEDAVRLYRRAAAAYAAPRDWRGLAETHHNLALVFRQAGREIEAIIETATAIRCASVLGDPSLQALALLGRAELYLMQDDPAGAERDILRASRLSRTAGDRLTALDADRLRALTALRANRPVEASDLADQAEADADRLGSLLLATECLMVSALARLALGLRAEAESCRSRVLTRLEQLGARLIRERFEQEWDRAGGGSVG
ncbi:MAG: tetratricopeptide repeat protein [Gemmatimonadales bacterium]